MATYTLSVNVSGNSRPAQGHGGSADVVLTFNTANVTTKSLLMTALQELQAMVAQGHGGLT